MAKDPLLALRSQFPILKRTNYLVSHSLGAMPRAAARALQSYARDWAERGVRAWEEGWWEMPVAVGDEIAALIGGAPGSVAMLPNVTLAQATVISALDFVPPRNRVVMTALDFPSVRYLYAGLARRLGAEVVAVPSDDGITISEDRLLAAIDERTALVAISWVLFRSGYILDVERIIRHAHAAGAAVVLDAFHAVGVLPVDVGQLGVDFLTGGVLKWLCGGPGGCFLYVSPAVGERFSPALTGWQAHRRPFAFEPEMEYTKGAWRWLNGTPVVPALYAAREGVRIVRQVGIAAIRAKSMRQTARLIELARGVGIEVGSPLDPERRGGTVTLRCPHAAAVARYLLANDILVDFRPDAGIRVAPHFYTKDEELEEALVAIARALESGAWREFETSEADIL
jgi:kynureninase